MANQESIPNTLIPAAPRGTRPISTRLPGQFFAQQRAHGDGNGEKGQDQGHDTGVARQVQSRQVGDLGQVDGADEPEPGNSQYRLEQTAFFSAASRMRPQVSGHRIPGHGAVERRRRPRDAEAGQIAGHCHHHHHDRKKQRNAAAAIPRAGAADDAAGDGAQQDGHQGTHLHHRIAAHEFGVVQVLGQDRELERPEERRLHAQEENHAKQQGNVLYVQRRRRQHGDGDFAELDVADQPRLLVAVRQRPCRGREQEERQDQQPGGDIDQQVRGVLADEPPVDEDQRQRELVQVVVEGPEELGDEQRQQPARAQQPELGDTPRRYLPGNRRGVVATDGSFC